MIIYGICTDFKEFSHQFLSQPNGFFFIAGFDAVFAILCRKRLKIRPCCF